MGVLRVRYWMFNYRPQWEAVSKEIASLVANLGPEIQRSITALNTKDRRWRLRGPEQHVPLPYGLAMLPLLQRQAAGADINHFFGSAGERWLTPVLARHRGVLTVAKDTASLGTIERNAPHLRKYRAIVVQGERDRELLRQAGVPDSHLHLIRPGVPLAIHRAAAAPFTILFASSPLTGHNLLSRGIYLLVRAAARLPHVRFILVWRRHQLAELRALIAECGADNVEVHDGIVEDMGAMYDRAHATVLPGLEHRSYIPCPRSGLESLAHGKPLLVSRFVSIADSVARCRAGVVFEPSLADFERAVEHLRRDYEQYQSCAQPYVQRYFSPAAHLELHRRLYQVVAS